MILTIVATLFVIAAGAFVYTTIAVNAEADREDSIVSVPRIGEDAHAFLRALAGSAGQQIIEGNEITLYQNGSEIFPALLDAIGTARESVHFSTFIYEAGEIPTRFAEAFAAAAKRGVEVRVVLDRRGCKRIPRNLIASMREAGCKVAWFRGIRWYNWARYNRRTHRKLLVVDGELAFTGGVGIADQWDGNADAPNHWRDSHVRIRGPAVLAVQAAFVDNWNEASGELPIGGSYFPLINSEGESVVCPVQSNPVNATSAAQRSMAVLIAGATRRLWITNAYFVPSPPFVQALCAAKKRGVDVKVLIPGRYQNQPAVGRASRQTWPRLLKGGVEIFEYEPTMIHAKTVVVDSVVSSIGSINFDPRSFALNAEFGIVALDAPLAGRLEDAFGNDIRSARRVVVEDLSRLSIGDKILDVLCYWIRAQL
ncbi:MAG TPA: phosphatidylserine/phosphatidylglycerophosphate/cardiolipin synthase family protein [Gemmatimonadaceae bacterium]